jgi:hypothetical protein
MIAKIENQNRFGSEFATRRDSLRGLKLLLIFTIINSSIY